MGAFLCCFILPAAQITSAATSGLSSPDFSPDYRRCTADRPQNFPFKIQEQLVNDRIPHHTCRLPHACVYQPACCIPDFCPAYDKTYHDPQSALWHTPISAGSADGSRDISAVSQNGNLPRRNGRKTLHHNRKNGRSGRGT